MYDIYNITHLSEIAHIEDNKWFEKYNLKITYLLN